MAADDTIRRRRRAPPGTPVPGGRRPTPGAAAGSSRLATSRSRPGCGMTVSVTRRAHARAGWRSRRPIGERPGGWPAEVTDEGHRACGQRRQHAPLLPERSVSRRARACRCGSSSSLSVIDAPPLCVAVHDARRSRSHRPRGRRPRSPSRATPRRAPRRACGFYRCRAGVGFVDERQVGFGPVDPGTSGRSRNRPCCSAGVSTPSTPIDRNPRSRTGR
jgi:hypothetical protein